MSKSIRNSLAVRFLLTTLVTLILALGISTAISYMITHRAMTDTARRELQRRVDDTVKTIDLWFRTQKVQIQAFSRETIYSYALEDTFKGRAAKKAVENRFAEMSLAYPLLANICLLDFNGKVVASDLPSDLASKLSIDKVALQRVASGQDLISNIRRSNLDQEFTFVLYAPIIEKSETVGFLYFEYYLERFGDLYISNLKAGASGYAFLLGADNRILVHPNAVHIGNDFFKQKQFLGSNGRLEEGFVDYTFQAVHKIGYAGYLDDIGATLVLSVPSKEFHGPSQKLGVINVLIACLASAFVVSGIVLLWKLEIAQPIQDLLQGIKDFREGKVRNQVVSAAQTELAEVSKSFHEMAEHIEKSTVSISELRAEQENLQTILDRMAVGILIVKERHVIRVNATLLEMVGLEQREDFITAFTAGSLQETEAFNNLSPNQSLETSFVHNNNRLYHLLREVQQIHLSGDEVTLVTYVDITEKKKSEEERRIYEQDLQAVSRIKALGTLSSGVAEQIDVPIKDVAASVHFFENAVGQLNTLIDDYSTCMKEVEGKDIHLELLESIDLKGKQQRAKELQNNITQNINRALSRLEQVSRIINAMKNISHQEGEEKESYNLNDGIENTIAISSSQWSSFAEIETDLDIDLPVVRCYIADINQVIINLLINAIDAITEKNKVHGGGKGVVNIRTFTTDSDVFVTIKDTGIGMDQEVMNMIFDPFFTTKEQGKGTGQGLSIVRRIIIDKHGGNIEVQSELGRGTEFTVQLPVSSES